MLAVVGLLLTALMLAPNAALAQAQGVRGEASITTTGGYGRIVIRTAADVESQVRMTSGILVIQFRQPVNVAVDRLGTGASEYIGAARRDPDGRALRFALTQKVKVSSMVAGDRLFVDLLPESWSGEPPGLPREVVEELAKRANEADRVARQKLAAEEQKKIPPVRVRVAAQPTFTRYIFELPELTGVTAERGKDKLTLTFAKPLRFDLSDAKLVAAKAVTTIDAGGSGDNPEVQFKFSQQADIRTFREDSNYVVDVSPMTPGTSRCCCDRPLAGVTRRKRSWPKSPSRQNQSANLRSRDPSPDLRYQAVRRPPRRPHRHAPGRRRRGRAAGTCGEEPAPPTPAKLDPGVRSSPNSGGRATICGCSFRSLADARGGVPARRCAVAGV